MPQEKFIRQFGISILPLGLLTITATSVPACDLVGPSDQLEIKIVVLERVEKPVPGALVVISESSEDNPVGMIHPGQHSYGFPGDGSEHTNDEGVAVFEGVRKGKIFLLIESEGYYGHCEVFEARTGKSYTKRVFINPRPE